MVVTLYNDFLNNPTVTSLEDASFPVTRVPFPGISVCSVNKISKRKAQDLATHLATISNKNQSLILRYVRFIGQLHDFDGARSKIRELVEFQTILKRSGLKLIDVIKDLAIPCDELLVSCVWQTRDVKCSEIFQMKLTQSGFCCVFNNYNNSSFFGAEAGFDRGLQIGVRNQLEDYFYSTLSSTGVVVQIFHSDDYPDKSSGNVNDILIGNSSESFIDIQPTTYEAVVDVEDYPVERRGCLFDKESPSIFSSVYSQSNCIIGCRIESALALCRCIPFQLPLSNDNIVCTIEDIPCLNRFRNKWLTLSPNEVVWEHLPREQHEALICSKKCYPKCSGTFYDVRVNSFPILNKSITKNHLTVAYIYYGRRVSNFYQTDVFYYWFEILSNFGGLFGILLGVSVISLIETVTYIFQKLLIIARFKFIHSN
ncbi:hypothetical protein Zmor_025087 [Zophobas morio]|uniref:Sodium channel protein Nach n=1 Tax=Zophobas morio TaxID=2755281 RepID=A0AA38HT59_9CUCU|nr:hypothetical protein Zmor_025087 [Zophobas morio]